MLRKKKMSGNDLPVQNPIEVFASLLEVLEPQEREEEIALYMEELERDTDKKDEENNPELQLQEAKNRAASVLHKHGYELPQQTVESPAVEETGFWDDFDSAGTESFHDSFAENGTEDSFEDAFGATEPKRKVNQKGVYRRKTSSSNSENDIYKKEPSGLSRDIIMRYAVPGAAVIVALIAIVVAVVVIYRASSQKNVSEPAGSGDTVTSSQASLPEEEDSQSDSSAVSESAGAGTTELPAGIENASSLSLELSDSVCTIQVGDTFALEGAEGESVTGNTMEGDTWVLTLSRESNTVTLTVPSQLQSIQIVGHGSEVSAEGMNTDTLSVLQERGHLELRGISTRQLTVESNQASVEVQADSIQEQVEAKGQAGQIHLAMPEPASYGYTITCNNGSVVLGDQTFHETAAQQEEAPFQYKMECDAANITVTWDGMPEQGGEAQSGAAEE